MNQAAKQFNFNMNYSPSANRFFTPGVDAQLAARHEELVSQRMDKFVKSMSGSDRVKNIFKNFHVSGQTDWKITVGVQAGGNTGGIGGTYGLFANLCSITLLGNEGGNRVYPGSRTLGYTQINQGLSGGFYAGAGLSHTFDGSFEGYGSTNETITYQGLAGNREGNVGINFQYDSFTGIHSMNIGWFPQYALFFGFEGVFDLKITW